MPENVTVESDAQSEALTKRDSVDVTIINQALLQGDLTRLTPTQRLKHYQLVCESLQLNPLTRPFDYLQLPNGKTVLYANRDATNQLRKLHGITITNIEQEIVDDLIVVKVWATAADGRSDFDVGAVSLGPRKGDDRANAIMKAVTKAKRRVTLSLAGLGMVDDSETDTIKGAVKIDVVK